MIKTVEKYGKKRKCKRLVCEQCNQEFWKPIALIRENQHCFCSKKCSDDFRRRTQVYLTCANCGKEFTANAYRVNKKTATKHKFCSRKCKDAAQRINGSCPDIRPDHYKDGEYSYRKWAFEHYSHECAYCGYKEIEDVLDVHHLDHNRRNNKKENLMILCPTCHAIETRGIGKFKWQDGKSILERFANG